MVPPMVFVTLCTWGEVEEEWLVFGVGGVVFAAGLALRIWAQMHLHYRLSVRKILTTTGPYRYVRNPIYIANTTMLTAAVMLAELFWFMPIMVLYCAVVYTLVVRHEESHLLVKYGAPYQAYLDRVSRWFPGRSKDAAPAANSVRFFYPSLWAECHNLALLLPFIIKELVVDAL